MNLTHLLFVQQCLRSSTKGQHSQGVTRKVFRDSFIFHHPNLEISLETSRISGFSPSRAHPFKLARLAKIVPSRSHPPIPGEDTKSKNLSRLWMFLVDLSTRAMKISSIPRFHKSKLLLYAFGRSFSQENLPHLCGRLTTAVQEDVSRFKITVHHPSRMDVPRRIQLAPGVKMRIIILPVGSRRFIIIIIIITIIISHTVLHDRGTLVLSESGVQSEVCELRQGNCTWPYHLQVSLDIT